MTLQEIIKLALKHARVTYPSVLIAQALHESGLLTAKGASGLASTGLHQVYTQLLKLGDDK